MMLDQSFSFKEQLNHKGILLCYEGNINQKIIEDIARIIKHNIDVNDNPLVMRRLFGMFIEQAQNILFYSSAQMIDKCSDNKAKKPVAILGKNDDNKYYMITGNIITKKQQDNLTELLEYINSLNKDELSKLYIKKIKAGSIAKGKGGGVGLIGIAKYTSGPLEYIINDIDENFSYFIMKTVIKGEK